MLAPKAPLKQFLCHLAVISPNSEYLISPVKEVNLFQNIQAALFKNAWGMSIPKYVEV